MRAEDEVINYSVQFAQKLGHMREVHPPHLTGNVIVNIDLARGWRSSASIRGFSRFFQGSWSSNECEYLLQRFSPAPVNPGAMLARGSQHGPRTFGTPRI